MNRSLLIVLLLVLPLGCHHATPPPASQPAPLVSAPQRFENKQAGIAFSYPAGWKPAGATAVQWKFDNGNAHLTLDYPNLPWHPFGLLTVDRVRSGYVDDAKKKMPDLQETDLPDPTVADAKQHRVKLTGHLNGKPDINEAAIFVHNDKVYILSIDSDEKSYPVAKAALDAAVQSLAWE